jgi:hypothetical protein
MIDTMQIETFNVWINLFKKLGFYKYLQVEEAQPCRVCAVTVDDPTTLPPSKDLAQWYVDLMKGNIRESL